MVIVTSRLRECGETPCSLVLYLEVSLCVFLMLSRISSADVPQEAMGLKNPPTGAQRKQEKEEKRRRGEGGRGGGGGGGGGESFDSRPCAMEGAGSLRSVRTGQAEIQGISAGDQESM